MFLDIGNQQRISDPTMEQVGLSFSNLPADAPFVILDADTEHFIQAMPAGTAWRVEWRQEAEQRFMIVNLDDAEEAFAAFYRWDEAALTSFPWKRLTLWNDPHRQRMFSAITLVIVGLLSLWRALV